MNRMNRIRIGTSGWHYPHWSGSFYPENIATEHWLDYYAEHFHTAEINNSFYQLPAKTTFEHWRASVPSDFTFAVKASSYITHRKKLNDPEESVQNFFERVQILGDQTGPILFQLPPRWHCNLERLAAFLNVLPTEYRYTFEFRDRTWLIPETYELLANHNAALCIYDWGGERSPTEVTADFIYLRLHGPKAPYQGEYSTQALAGWAGAFSTWARQGKDVYCYFDADEKGIAPNDAQRLIKMLNDS
ncbi:MAG: DUF72 domain-containing protein [Elainellaceae cyanobacterium]